MISMASVACKELVTPQHNIVTKENVNSIFPNTTTTMNGTVVRITCYVPTTYVLDGNPIVTCINGSWKPQQPSCVLKSKVVTTTPDTTGNGKYTDGYTDTSRIILIVTATVVAVIIIFLVAVFLYRLYLSRVQSNDNETQTSSSSIIPLNTTLPGSTIVSSTWQGNYRDWTYISVDHLIRDIERSRKENPNHSWRDFASVSAYSTNDF